MRTKELDSWQMITEAKAPSPPDVTLEEVQVAVFSNAADRIIFRRALSDIASQDATVRADAVRTIAVGWLGQEALAVKLLPLLADRSVSVRRSAIEAMGNLRSRQVVSALIERLNEPEESIRKAVLGALKTITGKKKMSERFPADEKSHQR